MFTLSKYLRMYLEFCVHVRGMFVLARYAPYTSERLIVLPTIYSLQYDASCDLNNIIDK